VVVDEQEGVLAGSKFRYFVKTSVTTVAGQPGVASSLDGPAREATMGNPAMLAVNDEGLIFVADEKGARVRVISLADNRVTTVVEGMNHPWQCALAPDNNTFFVLEREAAPRPLLFHALYKSRDWLGGTAFYDQTGADGEYVAGRLTYTGLAADDEYVYLISANGARLVRVDVERKTVELVAKDLGLPDQNHLCYNPSDSLLYISAENHGRVYRLDPRHLPATAADLEHVLGMGRGDPREGNGKNAQFGNIEAICADREGNLYICDRQNHVVWKVDDKLNATILAGTGNPGYLDGKPSESQFNAPVGVTATADGIVYVGEVGNHLVRCIAIQ
jgi:sugar lactone lactonase YvrE